MRDKWEYNHAMPRPRKQDPEVLQAALIGLQRMLEGVDQNIADLRRRLGVVHADSQPAPAKRTMSATARKRIALAQKKRWAAFKAKSQKAEEPQPKRELSAAGRARIIAATKKRWATFRKAQNAAAKQPAPKQAVKKAPGAKAAAAVAPPAAVAAPAAE
jgi:hypothetical protein